MDTPVFSAPAALLAALVATTPLALPSPASAASAAFENFNQYTAGTALAGLNGGVGWSATWRAVNGMRVSDQSITYDLDGRQLGGGNSLRVEANADNAFARSFLPAVDTTGRDYFVGFLFRLEGKEPGTTFTGNVFAGWQAEDGSPSTSIDNIGYTGGAGRAGARVNNLSSPVTTPLVYGQTYRMVIKFTGWDGERYTTTQVWLNPTVEDEASTDPAVTQVRTVAGAGSSGLSGLRVRTLGLGTTAWYLIDDLHVTHTWSELLAYPEVPDQPGDPTTPQTHVITEGPDWKPYAHPLEIAPGGVFDHTHLLDAPAGKHGALRITEAGQFEFTGRPGQRVRFAGVNLNFSAQFLSNADADQLAETLARSGYNTVRFHHFDNELRESLEPTPDGPLFTLNAAKLERLHYLFAAMKQRGLYISIDLYSIRGFNAAEIARFGLTSSSLSSNAFKALIPIDENAYQSWRRYAELLLTSVNPHTGMTWAEDPALIGICPVNEDNLYQTFESNTAVKTRYETLFEEAYPPSGESEVERAAKRYRFLHDLHTASDARLRTYLRSLNVRALLTGTNYGAVQALTLQRSAYDYVDNHTYFNHPTYPGTTGTLPLNSHNDSLVKRRVTMPRDVMTSRIYGKPYTVTEWNASRPNQYRGEASVLMPAYASLQDWDGLWCFQYGDTREMITSGSATGSFAITADPIGMLMSRTTALLFLRGDIAPAQRSVVWAVRPAEAFSSWEKATSAHFLLTGLISQVGSLPAEPGDLSGAFDAIVTGATPAPSAPLPPKTYLADGETLISRMIADGVLPEGSLTGYGETAVCRSDTGEITMDASAGTATVLTDRSELFALSAGAQLSGRRVSVSNGSTPASISVIALEGEDGQELSLAHARRILVTHLTDALPKGMEFNSPARTRLLSWGQLPHLVLRGEATLSLALAEGDWAAWVVDATGARVRQVPLTRSPDGRYGLAVASVTAEGVQLAYELVRPAAPPQLLGAVSRRTHGGAAAFDIPLLAGSTSQPPAGPLPIECRGGSELKLVVAFDKTLNGVLATVSEGTATVGSTQLVGRELHLTLAGVANAQALTVTLTDVTSVDGGTLPAASVRLGVLLGDVTADRRVTGEDIQRVRRQVNAGGTPDAETFRRDLNASNDFTTADFVLVRGQAGTVLH